MLLKQNIIDRPKEHVVKAIIFYSYLLYV